jgi:predicted outer membrane repeat protein
MVRLSALRLSAVILFALMFTFTLNLPIARTAGTVTICDEASLDTALAGGGTVTFACSGTITVTATKTISANTVLDGSGQNVTISGGGTVGVFTVNAGVSFEIRSLTISGGNAGFGGGVYNNGSVTISGSTFAGNNAGFGGAIFNAGQLTINDSTFSANTSTNNGGAVYVNAGRTLTLANSTFSGNTSATGGGGLYTNASTATIMNVTFSGNIAPVGQNINASGVLTISASILHNGNCSGTLTDGGSNIAFNAAGCPGNNVDPLLGVLGNYGGTTQTFPLQAGSPALDTFTAGCLSTDQRGILRPQGAACDSGAYEAVVVLSPSGTPIVVVPTLPPPSQCQDMLDPTFAAPVGWYCQVLMRNNAWVGVAGSIPSELIDAGVIIAVDVTYYAFAGYASQQVEGTHQVCLQGDGRFIFLSNAQAPRQIVELNSVSEGGYTCAWVTTAGTAVLIHD